MLERLISELRLIVVDGMPARTIPMSEVPSLNAEARYDAMKLRTNVVQLLCWRALTGDTTLECGIWYRQIEPAGSVTELA